MKYLLNNERRLALVAVLAAIVLLLFLAAFFLKKSPNDLAEIEIPAVPSFSFPDRICNITSYGAMGNGEFLNTKNINEAIFDCARNGGGKVLVPEGKWLTGPINLSSNIDLHLDEGAEILFSTNFDDYLPAVFSRFEGIELYNYSPFIYAKDCENVAITGKGMLNGQGAAWWSWKRDNLQASAIERLREMADREIPVEERIFGKDDALRPSFVQFLNCKNILMKDFRIKNGPMWTLHSLYSENLLIKDVSIETSEGPNTDGIVIDSSKNVTIDDAYIDSGDDAIALKSGKDKDGLRINKPSENIFIKNCRIREGHGAIAIGSEMSGGVRNVLVENTKIGRADFGIHIKSTKERGGFVENIVVRNMSAKKISSDMIRLDMRYNRTKNASARNFPRFENMHFEDISCEKTKNAFFLRGLPESPIKNVSFEDIETSSKAEIFEENVGEIHFKDVGVPIRDAMAKTKNPQ